MRMPCSLRTHAARPRPSVWSRHLIHDRARQRRGELLIWGKLIMFAKHSIKVRAYSALLHAAPLAAVLMTLSPTVALVRDIYAPSLVVYASMQRCHMEWAPLRLV